MIRRSLGTLVPPDQELRWRLSALHLRQSRPAIPHIGRERFLGQRFAANQGGMPNVWKGDLF